MLSSPGLPSTSKPTGRNSLHPRSRAASELATRSTANEAGTARHTREWGCLSATQVCHCPGTAFANDASQEENTPGADIACKALNRACFCYSKIKQHFGQGPQRPFAEAILTHSTTGQNANYQALNKLSGRSLYKSLERLPLQPC